MTDLINNINTLDDEMLLNKYSYISSFFHPDVKLEILKIFDVAINHINIKYANFDSY